MNRATTAAVDVVVFDLGGVLIDWDPRYLYRQLFDDDARMEWFLSEVCSPDWNAEQDGGRTWDEAVAEAQERHPGEAERIAAYRDRWPEMLAGAIEPTVAVLEALHAKDVPLYALTNWSRETFPVAREQYPFLGLFRDIVVSGEVMMKKPDPEIFHLLLSKIGVEPGSVLFIDDSPANVQAAEALGLAAHHFRDAGSLGLDPRLKALLGGD